MAKESTTTTITTTTNVNVYIDNHQQRCFIIALPPMMDTMCCEL